MDTIMTDKPTADDTDLDGYPSDESSFYGDETTVAELESRAAAYDPGDYWRSRDRNIQRVTAAARKEPSVKAEKKTSSNAFQVLMTKPPTLGPKNQLLTPSTSSASMTESKSASPVPIKEEKSSASRPENQLEPFNPREGLMSARQLSEPIPDFLRRLPPSTTTMSDIGPWIWIHNFLSPNRLLDQDIATLKTEGLELLASYSQKRHDMELANPSTKPFVITKRMKPHFELLQTSLSALARRTGVTSGKWMLFVPPSRVDEVWAKIAHATAEGSLPYLAKVAVCPDSTPDSHAIPQRRREGDVRLICIYTSDFEDKPQIRTVLKRLRELGVFNDGTNDEPDSEPDEEAVDARPIYYKSDLFTHLGVFSGNEWKLKASLYGSRDVDMR